MELEAKTHLGVHGIQFTRLGVGCGSRNIDYNNRSNIENISYLIEEKQSVEISSVKKIDETTVRIRGILSNKELKTGYYISEVGLFANDPDEGEILYSIVLFTNQDFFPAFNGFSISTITLTYYTLVGSTDSLIISILPDAYAAAVDLQELIEQFNNYKNNYLIDVVINHNLNAYPEVLVIESDFSYGMGYGVGPYGGTNGRKLRNSALYLNRNSIKISVEKQFNPVKTITPVNDREYIINFVESTLSLYVILFVSSSTPSIPIDQSGKSYFYLTLY